LKIKHENLTIKTDWNEKSQVQKKQRNSFDETEKKKLINNPKKWFKKKSEKKEKETKWRQTMLTNLEKRQIPNQTKETRGSWKPTAAKEIYNERPNGFEVRNSFYLLNSTMNASAYLPAFDDTFIEHTDSTHTVQTVVEKHHQNTQKTDGTSPTMTKNTEKNTITPEVIGQGRGHTPPVPKIVIFTSKDTGPFIVLIDRIKVEKDTKPFYAISAGRVLRKLKMIQVEQTRFCNQM
jgi:Zn-dependent M16 (insulinase) family peptidase